MEIPEHLVPVEFQQRVDRELLAAHQRVRDMGFEIMTHICKTEGCEEIVSTNKGLAGWCSVIQSNGLTHRQGVINSRRKEVGLPVKFLPKAEDLVVIEEIEELEPELVDHPNHYGGDTTYEVIKVLEAWEVTNDAYIFNVIKYLARAGRKPTEGMLTDLKKAQWYLNRKIDRMISDGA